MSILLLKINIQSQYKNMLEIEQGSHQNTHFSREKNKEKALTDRP